MTNFRPDELDVKVEGNNIIIVAKQTVQESGKYTLKGEGSSLILDFLIFFSTQSICRHQGSISLFGTDLVLGLLTKVIDASRSENVS